MHRLPRIPLRRYHIHKQSTSTQSLSTIYTCKYFSTANIEQSHDASVLNNETNLEYLPDGITRHVDFFGEAITFVNNVDCNSIKSIYHQLPTSIQSQQSTGANTQTADIVDAQTVLPSSSSSPSSELSSDRIINATSSFDGMALCILSRGSANLHTGNDGDGPEARAFHSSAMAWSELIRCAWEWNCNNVDSTNITTSPMLAVASVAPVLAQGGSHYVHRIDRLLSTTRDMPNAPPPSLYEMAQNAVSFRDAILPTASSVGSSSTNEEEPIHLVTQRERWHLHALHQLLQDNHHDAMGAYLRLLELYPGDLLGLSLALDVAHTIGDSEAACRTATNVSSYWTERDGGALRLQQSHPAQNMATSLISVGLSSSSSSSRASTAERLAEIAMARDAEGSGGTSIWAISNCLASEGRSSEMTSKLSSYDGTQSYEACGYLHFNTRMKGYAGIALLDQKRNGADRSALAKYDGGFGNVLEYSGNTVEGQEKGGEEVCLREKRIPRSVKEDVAGAVGSMFTGWFGSSNNGGGGSTHQTQQQSDSSKEGKSQDVKRLKRRTVEDVMCWLPPTPLLLTHATALLLRLTLCEAIPESDDRWADMRVAWCTALESANNDTTESKSSIEFMPLAMVASSLVIDPNEHLRSNNKVSQPLQSAMQGLHKMGKLMKLGQLKLVSTSALDESSDTTLIEDEWREVMKLLAQARDCQRWEMPTGLSSSTYTLPTSNEASSSPIGWDFDLRQFLEYPLNYAAMQVGDYESLCLARTICSEGTTLRSNCPEVWWRYGNVLDKLGDGVAAENARAASISLGSGEGGGKF